MTRRENELLMSKPRWSVEFGRSLGASLPAAQAASGAKAARACARPSAVEHLLAANAQRERLYVEVHGDHLLCAIGERTVEEAAEELRQLALALVPLVAGRPRRSRSTASSR